MQIKNIILTKSQTPPSSSTWVQPSLHRGKFLKSIVLPAFTSTEICTALFWPSRKKRITMHQRKKTNQESISELEGLR
ncbi:hypothetical protein L1987_19994 [Smallanthus sonchifolius]|uniref:Uncharacterized protein n=1 Tax=Smallanthus sonchifolius TaxID=185202 RepID=A0ACB9IQK2_9ASTR|nr:hypothetical protein L1987_19994 [Smallanthus sonchifolius]